MPSRKSEQHLTNDQVIDLVERYRQGESFTSTLEEACQRLALPIVKRWQMAFGGIDGQHAAEFADTVDEALMKVLDWPGLRTKEFVAYFRTAVDNKCRDAARKIMYRAKHEINETRYAGQVVARNIDRGVSGANAPTSIFEVFADDGRNPRTDEHPPNFELSPGARETIKRKCRMHLDHLNAQQLIVLEASLHEWSYERIAKEAMPWPIPVGTVKSGLYTGHRKLELIREELGDIADSPEVKSALPGIVMEAIDELITERGGAQQHQRRKVRTMAITGPNGGPAR